MNLDRLTTARNRCVFPIGAKRSHPHLALIRLCALSLVSFFCSSVRGGEGGRAAGGKSGHCLSRMLSMNAAICTAVGFIFLRKEFTFLEEKNTTRSHSYRQGSRWPIQLGKGFGSQHQTHFFKMGITGFNMASNMLMRMEFPVKTDMQSIRFIFDNILTSGPFQCICMFKLTKLCR